jgi:hypothetical protein
MARAHVTSSSPGLNTAETVTSEAPTEDGSDRPSSSAADDSITKREKRRLREARKKSELKSATARRSQREHVAAAKRDEPIVEQGRQFSVGSTKPSSDKRSRKKGPAAPSDNVTLDDSALEKIYEDIGTKGEKMVAKWDSAWEGTVYVDSRFDVRPHA